MQHKRTAIALWVILLTVAPALAGEKGPIKLHAKDKCPVCGMFPAKYPDFSAQIVFKDGSYAVFDGVKDLFKYYFKLASYNPSKKLSDIDAIYVTDYYSLGAIDGYKAWYVGGSKVYGPMGRELVAFVKEAEAREFMVDHAGDTLLRFHEVAPELVRDLQ